MISNLLNRYTTVFEGFDLWKGIPLDKRIVISSLQNINDDLPINHRYYGIIFFSKQEKTFYTFESDLTTIVPIFSLNDKDSSNVIFEDNYMLIGDRLNAITEVGKYITVLPLGVVFRFNGTEWLYVTGVYNFRNNIELNNLLTELKFPGCPVILNNEGNKVFDGNRNVVDQFTKITSNNQNIKLSTNNDNFIGRTIIDRHSIHTFINGQYYKTGVMSGMFENKILNIGLNELFRIPKESNIKRPPYIKSIFWIKNYISKTDNKQYLIPIEMQIIFDETETEWIVNVLSEINNTGDLEIIYM